MFKYKYIKNRLYHTLRPYYAAALFISGSLAFSHCSQKAEIKGFDEASWQKDVRSCDNIRPGLLPALKDAFPQLMGLNHNQIIHVLGKPEGNSLEKSGERVYYYFVEPGTQCDNKSLSADANKLMIRFDAFDRVYKVRLEN